MMTDEELEDINWFLHKDGKLYASRKGRWLLYLIPITMILLVMLYLNLVING